MERASETKGCVPGGSTCAHAARGAAMSGVLVTSEATHRLCTAHAPPVHRLCTASAPPMHRFMHRSRHRPGTLASAPSCDALPHSTGTTLTLTLTPTLALALP